MMRFKHTMLSAPVCFLFLVAAALAQEASLQQSGDDWGAETDGFRLSIATDKREYRLGELILLTARLKNTGATAARVESADPLFMHSFDITKQAAYPIGQKDSVPLTLYGRERLHPTKYTSLRDTSLVGFPLQVGKETTALFKVNEIYEVSSPGTYEITVSRKVPARIFGNPRNLVVSNRITLVVLPADPE